MDGSDPTGCHAAQAADVLPDDADDVAEDVDDEAAAAEDVVPDDSDVVVSVFGVTDDEESVFVPDESPDEDEDDEPLRESVL